MEFAVYGSFNLREALAMSPTHPDDSIQWGHKTLLEGAASAGLDRGGLPNHANSHHFGGQMSTVIYHGQTFVLCQVDNPLDLPFERRLERSIEGIFVCDYAIADRFTRGIKKLINERINPTSPLNKLLSEAGRPPANPKTAQRLLTRLNPQIVDEVCLPQFLMNFYSGHTGTVWHTGFALNYLGLPNDHLIAAARTEWLQFEQSLVSRGIVDEDHLQFLETYLKDPSKVFAQ